MVSQTFRTETLLLLFLLAVAGCAAKAASSQVAGVNPCNVDAAAICQTIRSAPVVDTSTGISEDNRAREGNAPMTVSEIMNYSLKSGNAIEVECFINTHTNAVVYAKASPGAPLTAEDVDFLRSQGACKE